LGLGACASDTSALGDDQSAVGAGTDGAGSNTGQAGGASSGAAGGGDLTTQDEVEGCATLRADGDIERAPVDIVWVVDASGSMVDEQQRIQENLEAFASAFAGAGVNAHVVMLTEADIGSCTALAGTPEYLFVEADVDSSNSLEVLLDQFDDYRGHLRADAVTHFIVVTDDESDVEADSFRSQMEQNLGHGFILHAIASEDTGMISGGGGFGGGGFGGFGGACTPAACEDNITGACGGNIPGFGGFGGFGGGFCGATRPGRIYYDLADQTGGEKISICADDWGEVFARLQSAVIATSALPCSFEVPDAPQGETLDLDLVRIDFTPSGDTPRQFPRASRVDSCGNNEAWHYDDPTAPSQIVLCPSACEAVQRGGSIEIVLACEADEVLVI
jgi:hypothetical protein